MKSEISDGMTIQEIANELRKIKKLYDKNNLINAFIFNT